MALEYSHEERAELLYELCAALTREGLGTVAHWQDCGGQSLVFAQRSLMSAIGEKRWDLLKRNVEFQMQISDTVDRVFDSSEIPKGCLALTIECGGCGYLRIGPAIEALEREAQGLGAAFYWELLHAIDCVMRVYDHRDALQFEEQMREWAEADEGSQEQYEFPDVEKALPECLRRGKKDRKQPGHARRLLLAARFGPYAAWITRLRRMRQLARAAASQNNEECGYYDSPPLPALLIAFQERDAITACFDEEGQHMLEGSPEPALRVLFDPKHQDEVRRAYRTVARFFLFNQELFEFAEELVQWEKTHGHPFGDRTEPSLRAA